VVADLIHLLAELVDNATSFSPPQSQVEVRGNAVGRGVVVEIEDQGLGIEPDDLEQINAMLHHPPDFGVMALSTESRIGLFVVARLAARHGIKVTLRDSVYDGTRATVLIPSALIAETPEEPEAGGPRETASGARHLEPAWQRRPDPVDTAEPTPGSAAEPTPGSAAEPTAGSAAELASRTGTGRATRGADPQTVSLAGQLPAERDGDGASGNGHAVGPNGSAPGNGSPPPAGPATPRVSAQPPGGTRPRPAGPAPASRPTPPGGPRAERPPLPRRERQRNLAPQLLDDDAAEPAAADPGGAADEQGPRRTPEHSRSTMSAFQQGTRRARAGESEPVAPRRPGRSG
jgi:hypothetical protein